MASIRVGDLLMKVKPFDPNSDPLSIGRQQQRWLKSFLLCGDSKALIIQADKADNKVQRRALLLHCAGEQLQEIFQTLADTGSAAEYEKAVNALNAYFIPKANSGVWNSVMWLSL